MIGPRFRRLMLGACVIFAGYWLFGSTCGGRADNLMLIDAARKGDVERVRSLLRLGADPNAPDFLVKNAPLARAAIAGQTEAVKALLAGGADPNRQYGIPHHKPPLIWAILNDHPDTARALFEGGANPELEGCERGTALDAAVNAGDVESVSLLLSRGTPNRESARRESAALQEAAEAGRDAVIRFLLTRGADPNTPNSEGKTALDLAELREHPTTVALLKKAGGRHGAALRKQEARPPTPKNSSGHD